MSPDPGRGPPEPGHVPWVSALYGVWHLLARLGASHAEPGHDDHRGDGTNPNAAALSRHTGGGRRRQRRYWETRPWIKQDRERERTQRVFIGFFHALCFPGLRKDVLLS